MFDKWQAHARFTRAGLPRPVTELAPTDASVFLAHCRSAPGGRLFLKPRYGSSASGCSAIRWQGNRIELNAPIEIERKANGRVRLFNTLRVRRYIDLGEIGTILERLLPQGMIQERWLPKATLPGGSVDLRILVVAGEARHRVLRQSRSPMTNLHLGNRRADTMELERVFPGALARACQLAVDAAACFPDSLYAGVDILLDTRGRVYVCEINAFGDLLPGLSDRGQTTFEAIAAASLVPGSALEATSRA